MNTPEKAARPQERENRAAAMTEQTNDIERLMADADDDAALDAVIGGMLGDILAKRGVPDDEEVAAAMRARGMNGDVLTRAMQLWRELPAAEKTKAQERTKAKAQKAAARAKNERDAAPRRGFLSTAPTTLPAPGKPLEVAKEFVKLWATDAATGLPTLRLWRGDWYVWAGTHWDRLDDQAVRNAIWKFAEFAQYTNADGKNVPWAPTSPKVSNVLDALRSRAALDDRVEPGTWFVGPLEDAPAGRFVALANGLLNFASRALIAHTPRFFNLTALPFDYDPNATCPGFDRFVASLWDEDDETPRVLAQMLGYLVSGRTNLHCMFGLIGPRRAGKSTVARLATELLGKGNVAALTQAAFGETFGLQHVIGKSLAIISDARTSGRNPQTVVERLLSITGEDAVPVPRKFKDAWQGRLHARVMILSNETPHFGDASTAVSHRFIMLPFSRSFEGREDRALEGKLIAELPGILNWALDGLADLDASGGVFAQSKAAREMVEAVAELSSPLLVFMREECDLAPAYRVEKDKLYQRYEHWARSNGMPLMAAPVFARSLLAASEGKIGRSRGGSDGARVQVFTGIRLRLGAAASAAEKAASMGLETLPGGRDP